MEIKGSLPLVGGAKSVWPQGWLALPGSAEPLCGSELQSAPDSGSLIAILPACCEGSLALGTLLPVPSTAAPHLKPFVPFPSLEPGDQQLQPWTA